jgi:hypothetical protein
MRDAKGEDFQDYLISSEEAEERRKLKVPGKGKAVTEIPTGGWLDAILAMNGVDDNPRKRAVNIIPCVPPVVRRPLPGGATAATTAPSDGSWWFP